MINNSSLGKWDRLAQKQLDQQFTHEIIHGRQCSPFEASAILDTVYRVYAPYFETSGTLKHGQILWNAWDKDTRGNSPGRRYVPVVLTVVSEQDVKQLTEGVGMSRVAEGAIARMIREAYQQGGILSCRDIGLLCLRSPPWVSQAGRQYEPATGGHAASYRRLT